MYLAQQLKRYSIEALIIGSIFCALLLMYTASSFTINKTALFLPFLLLAIGQGLIYRNYLSLRRRHRRMHQVSKKLLQVKTRRRKDEALALSILNHINTTTKKVPDHAHVWQKPLEGFSGDLALAFESQQGHRYTLLADLTGHGITAAISAAPVASIFRGTVRRCLTVAEIVTELNNQLQVLLPSGLFCCATVILEYEGTVTVCNAGLPDILITDNEGKIVNTITSTQLPLGIDLTRAEDVELFTAEYQHRHQLYAYTDGLIETTGANDEVFDIDTIASLVSSKSDDSGRLGKITDSFESFAKDSAFNDDISIVEVMIR